MSPFPEPERIRLATALPAMAREAGAIIMDIRNSGDLGTLQKDDDRNSPATHADRKVNAFLMEKLSRLAPDIPIISEENDLQANKDILKNHDTFWLIDPLDGTQHFINDESYKGYRFPDGFAVHIALIHEGKPLLGVAYFPALEWAYYTGADGYAYKQWREEEPAQIEVWSRKPEDEPGSRKQPIRALIRGDFTATDAAAWGVDMEETPIRESSSHRICMVADGMNTGCDVAISSSDTSGWDTAAPHAVLYAAGGDIYDARTKMPLRYNSGKDQDNPFANPHFLAGRASAVKGIEDPDTQKAPGR